MNYIDQLDKRDAVSETDVTQEAEEDVDGSVTLSSVIVISMVYDASDLVDTDSDQNSGQEAMDIFVNRFG